MAVSRVHHGMERCGAMEQPPIQVTVIGQGKTVSQLAPLHTQKKIHLSVLRIAAR